MNKPLNTRRLVADAERNAALAMDEGDIGRQNIAVFNRVVASLAPVLAGEPLGMTQRRILASQLCKLEDGLDRALLKDCADLELGREINGLVAVVTA